MNNASILGYTGSFLDPVTRGYPLGNGYRMYLPGLMRFNAPDDFSPFDAGGLNCYTYCTDDPINGADPTGHMYAQEDDPMGAAAAEQEQCPTNYAAESFGETEQNPWPYETRAPVSGPSTSGTNLAVAHTQETVYVYTSRADNPEPQRVNIDKIPVTDDEVSDFFHLLVGAHQVRINVDDYSKEMWSVDDLRVDLNGVPLKPTDKRLRVVMKKTGAVWRRRRWQVKLLYRLDRASRMKIGLNPSQIEYRIILLPKTRRAMMHTREVYNHSFGWRADEFGLETKWSNKNHRYRQVLPWQPGIIEQVFSLNPY